MTQFLTGSRTAILIIVLLAFLSSILLAAEFDLVMVSEPASGAGKRHGLELQELLAISGIFSILMAGVAWLNGRAAVADRRERRALEHTAFLDPLTGLSNRRLFNERLGTALARARREGLACAVVLIDLDKFKHVNDSMGHAVGDRLLIEVSDRIRSFPAVAEDAARLGGDEFAIILRSAAASQDHARSMIHRLRDAIGEPLVIDGRTLCPGASIGIAFASESTSRGSDMLEAADADMYRDKELRRRSEAA